MPRWDITTGNLPAQTNALVALTLPKVQPKVVDAFFKATPFFWWMRDRGRVFTVDGGDSFEFPIMYDQNPYARAYQPYEVTDVGPPQGFTNAVYVLAHYRVPILYSRSAVARNRGDAQIVNFVDAIMEQARRSLVNAMNEDLWRTSDLGNTTKLYSMTEMIYEGTQANNTRVIGGIKASDYDWWANKYLDKTSYTDLVEAIDALWIEVSNGAETPDLALCDTATYRKLETALREDRRFVNARAIDFGFDNIAYKRMTIMYDKSISSSNGVFYMINSDFLKLAIGSDANFRVIAPEYVRDIDAYEGLILVDAQVVTSNRQRLGVLGNAAQ